MDNEKTEETKNTEAENVRKLLASIKDRIRITKVTCTRSVKSPRGDHFVGFSAQYDTVQDDAGGMGEDLIGDTASGEAQIPLGAMTLKEGRVAAALVQMQADISAIEHAFAGGDLNRGQRNDESQRIKGNFSRYIAEIMGV